MRTAAYNDEVASVCASLRSLLNECHWHSATPQAPECAKAHSLFYGLVSRSGVHISFCLKETKINEKFTKNRVM